MARLSACGGYALRASLSACGGYATPFFLSQYVGVCKKMAFSRHPVSDIRQYTQFYLKNQLDAHNSQYYPRCVKNHWESCHLTFFVRKEDIMRKLAFCFVAVAVSFDGFAVIDFDTPKVGEYKFQRYKCNSKYGLGSYIQLGH